MSVACEPAPKAPLPAPMALSGGPYDIFLSYAWAHQPLCRRIRDALRGAGLRVWWDEEVMAGDIATAMAEGIAGARVVLLCVSKAYQDSANCRSEATYARQRRSRIVVANVQVCTWGVLGCCATRRGEEAPAFLQPGASLGMESWPIAPWLEFMIAGKLWADFRGASPHPSDATPGIDAAFESGMAVLVKNLAAEGLLGSSASGA